MDKFWTGLSKSGTCGLVHQKAAGHLVIGFLVNLNVDMAGCVGQNEELRETANGAAVGPNGSSKGTSFFWGSI
eukprot:scaffold303270_cov43-Prasinocladus_malaysianus.AAC.1